VKIKVINYEDVEFEIDDNLYNQVTAMAETQGISTEICLARLIARGLEEFEGNEDCPRTHEKRPFHI
jgi:hypothetical protein